MLKYVGAILGIIIFLLCLFYYAMRPVGALGITVANSYSTNSGYMVVGSVLNQGTVPLTVRATNEQVELTMHVQISTNNFRAGPPPNAPFFKRLLPGEKFPFEVFVPTNAPAILMTPYIGNLRSVRMQMRALFVSIYTLGKGSASGSEVASIYVAPPSPSE